MSTKTISCFLLILCSVFLVRVKSQICYGIAQYDKCSPNTGCSYLHIPGAINVGFCSYEFLADCSELVKCDHNSICYEPDHRCVHHPRCQSAPVCYPVPTYNRQLCPPITSKRTVSYLESEDVTVRFLYTCPLKNSHTAASTKIYTHRPFLFFAQWSDPCNIFRNSEFIELD
ncbi:unnamed protein product [Rotaria magnacalcarata]|uniref:Uncharacterized protein n=1 Tax=Rotaria magnacalcarata TaxID=392030 RepID=A0A816ZPY6_9BILA|nr:unnamed protein product [Rotaria magnacalcarata]